jgi:hypothetical protein
MGHCYVQVNGVFVGLVHTNSLHTREEYIKYLRERIGTHSDNPTNKAAINVQATSSCSTCGVVRGHAEGCASDAIYGN